MNPYVEFAIWAISVLVYVWVSIKTYLYLSGRTYRSPSGLDARLHTGERPIRSPALKAMRWVIFITWVVFSPAAWVAYATIWLLAKFLGSIVDMVDDFVYRVGDAVSDLVGQAKKPKETLSALTQVISNNPR